MKSIKKVSTLILLLLLSVSAFAYTHYGFSVKCAKCIELHSAGQAIEIQIAWRTYDYKSENGKVFAIFRCPGGHKYWAELK